MVALVCCNNNFPKAKECVGKRVGFDIEYFSWALWKVKGELIDKQLFKIQSKIKGSAYGFTFGTYREFADNYLNCPKSL